MRRRRLVFPVLLGLLLVAALLAALRRSRARAPGVRAAIASTAALGGADTAGFARALAPRTFRFPADHGPHLRYRNEWWYFTGNLRAPDGRRFGYELTFFRTALIPRPPARSSDWAARDVYMAHFAITDSTGRRFVARDRFARGGRIGLAGATAPADGWRVWLEDWSAASLGTAGTRSGARPVRTVADPAARRAGTGSAALRSAERRPPSYARPPVAGFWPIQLAARDSGMALGLVLERGKPPVLEGDHGLSRKGPERGDASYYYSLTRLPTRGWLELDGRRWSVAGESWMDREWSTSALEPDEVGWDWFALQLSDGRELMLYRLRRRDGGISPYSAGTLVGVDGSAQPLAAGAVRLEVTGSWTSPADGTRYPASWRVSLPSAALELDVRPIVADQELNLAVRYWEGAVDVRGTAGGRPIRGHGYVELTGYAPEASNGPASGLAP